MSSGLTTSLREIAAELTRFERVRFAITSIVFVVSSRVATRLGGYVLAWGDVAVARKMRREVNAKSILQRQENKRVRTLH